MADGALLNKERTESVYRILLDDCHLRRADADDCIDTINGAVGDYGAGSKTGITSEMQNIITTALIDETLKGTIPRKPVREMAVAAILEIVNEALDEKKGPAASTQASVTKPAQAAKPLRVS